jgi:GDP-4-dehydro-6-deoxy-D-mannose reductase
VTGGHGFVGGWLRRHLAECGDEVASPDERVDVTDPGALTGAMTGFGPDAVYHLAALTHVGDSWLAPGEVFRVNAMGTLNVLEAARRCDPAPRVVVVGSAEEYGVVSAGELPVREDAPLRPVSPYAASKVAAEFLALQAYLGYGLPALVVRPFNHVGPGQPPSFVVSAIAHRVVEAERTGTKTVRVGNLEPRRDFTDVRDVVRAYRMVAEAGEPGEAYNVCSGRDVSVAEIAEVLKSMAAAEVTFEVDPALVRPVDLPVLRGDGERLRSATGWRPQIDLERTLADVLESCRQEART